MGELASFGDAPLLDRAELRAWPPIDAHVREELGRVLDRGVLAGEDGPAARELEARFAEWVGARHALSTHAGTSALHIALIAVGLRPGDEVIVPAYGYISGPMCVLTLGGIPRFVDVDPATGNLDPIAVARAANERVRAIMPMHIHGCPADMVELGELAGRHGWAVVEDAAQAHGATYRGRRVGTFGAAGVFSLHESKPLPAGEGGLFVTDDDRLMEEARAARCFGLRAREGYPLLSWSPGHMFRANEMTAAVALAQLPRLEERVATAQANADALRRGLHGLDGLQLQRVGRDRSSTWYKVRLELDPVAAGVDLPPAVLRDRMCEALDAVGVEAHLWQHALLPDHPVFGHRSVDEGHRASDRLEAFPHARRLLDRSLFLFSRRRPLIAQRIETVERVAAAVHEVWAARRSLSLR